MRLADMEYTRGLYCHAFSKIIVRLPSPGASFSAIVGVDSNEQTSGGRGSVDFSVSVGGKEKFRSGVMREGMAGQTGEGGSGRRDASSSCRWMKRRMAFPATKPTGRRRK